MDELAPRDGIRRLEQRGGELWLMGGRSPGVFRYVGRESAGVIVEVPGAKGPASRFVLRSELDRTSLANEIETTRSAIAAGAGVAASSIVLVHRAALDTDAGYAQVGCFIVIASQVVGLVVAIAVSVIAFGTVSPGAVVIGFIAAFVVGFFGTEVVGSVTARVPRLRTVDAAVAIAFAWWVVVPALIEIVVIVLGSRSTPS